MADILTQDEIEALLSATDDGGATDESRAMNAFQAALDRAGIGGPEAATLTARIRELAATDEPCGRLELLSGQAATEALEGRSVSRTTMRNLKQAAKALLRETRKAGRTSDDEPSSGHQRAARQAGQTQAMRCGSDGDEVPQEPEGAHTADLEESTDQRIVTTYDFKHPARVNKDQLRTLESLHDNFARLLSSTFSGAMRAVVDVDTAFVDQTTYAEFIMSLPNPSCSYQFTLGPTNGQAIIDFAMPVVFAFVDRIFGGRGSSAGVDARQLTPIEIGVINRIIKRVIEDLEATWEPILRVEIADTELETNPEFIQITAASEIVILLAFEVNSANCSGLVSLCYPFFTLESILPRLGQQNYVRSNRLSRGELMRQNRARLGPVRVPVRAEIGQAELTVEEVGSLEVGQVICTGSRSTDPCVVYAGGEPKYLARPFVNAAGELGLQVVGKVPGERQTQRH